METKRKLSNSNCILENQQKKTNFLTQIDFTNFIAVPQLESITILRVVTVLCKQPDVRDAILHKSCDIRSKEAEPFSFIDSNPIVESILDKLSLLPLPNVIKAKVSQVIKPIVIQIMLWLHCINIHIGHDILRTIGYSTLDSLCWTSQGMVDRTKALKQLIEVNHDSGFLECKEITQHIYELACLYCLEDKIPSFWKKLAKVKKFHYLYGDLYGNDEKHLIAYWSLVNNNELSKLPIKLGPHYMDVYNWKHSIYKNMFSVALHLGNISAVKYFWGKLTAEEIICNLEHWVNETIEYLGFKMDRDDCYYLNTNEYADILYFLLSKVSAETQKEVIQKNSHVILQSLFLFHPYQRFLLPVIQTLWDSLDKKIYIKLLKVVANEMSRDKQIEPILRELCCGSPINLKQCFIRNIVKGGATADNVLHELLTVGDIATVKEMISYTNVEEKKQIAEKVTERYFSNVIIIASSLNFIDQFFQEISLLESEILNIKKKIGLELGSWFCRSWFHYNDWQMVESFLTWAFTSQVQIDYFKKYVMEEQEKIDIAYDLFKLGDYELLNRFISWCCCSKLEIDQFKKQFAFTKPEIVKIGEKDWRLFEKFIDWSSLSEQEINKFKRNVLKSEELKDVIGYRLRNDRSFQFVDKLLNWCCQSDEEMQLYKEKFVLLPFKFLFIVGRFEKKRRLMKKLFSFFSPISDEVKIKLKKDIAESCVLRHVKKEHLFHLVDGDTEDDSVDQVSLDEVSEASEISSDEQEQF